MIDKIIDVGLAAAWEIFKNSSPKTAKKVENKTKEIISNEYNKVNKRYSEISYKASNLDNNELKEAYKNSDNNFEKGIYGNEIKNRIQNKKIQN